MRATTARVIIFGIVLILLAVATYYLRKSVEVVNDYPAPNTPPPAFMLDDILYYSTGREVSIEVDEADYLGRTISIDISEFPSKNGQANILFESAPYVKYQEGIVILFDTDLDGTDEWTLYETRISSEEYKPLEPFGDPTDDTPVEAPPFPGLPVYIDNEAWLEQEKEWEQQAIDGPDAPPVEDPGSPPPRKIFDHFDDPPKEGTIRLVHVYNYGDSEAVLVEAPEEVVKILAIVDGFKISDYNGGPMVGGYLVNIQVVRNGIHQSYEILSVNSGTIVENERDVENCYETSEGSLEMLMGYFKND